MVPIVMVVENEAMSRSIPLNPGQLEILAWVREGAPDDVYDDYRPRIVARALHNKGLVTVRGSGGDWSVSLTEDGAFYLDNGEYPREPEPPATSGSVAHTKKPVSSTSDPAPKQRVPKTPGVGPTDAMMAALVAAPDHRIEIEYNESGRYEQLARAAERFKKIPDGMQITVSHDSRTLTAHVTLHPLPEWRTRVLAPIPVLGTLRGASDVVQGLQTREDFEIRTSERNRALRLVQALVSEALSRGYEVSKTRGRRKNQWGYFDRNEEDPGHFKIALGPDEYKLSVYQLTEKREHIATKSELARAGRGYALPKWDVVPTGGLGIRIDAPGAGFWGSTWADRDDRALEDALAQILQELELRHDAAIERRRKEELQRIERKRQWEIARDEAVQALTDSHRAEVLARQVAKWREVAAIREYAGEMEQRVLVEADGGKRAAVLEWVQWAREYADRVDPLRGRIRLPAPPEATYAALQPFMGSWSANGPEVASRW
ncbi:hypothetical protein [Microterricola viridarii]|uniref:PE-PGRS family protein n=1 Tax=Microterricola viridarii TaxID=412690 RepID=A0A1H1SY51_9MICO|nr:hypothetical protein [Microterricola viridarii]SDS52900.1 hypothetical protein SAMN04489834_1648 [Microterricola viridarii]